MTTLARMNIRSGDRSSPQGRERGGSAGLQLRLQLDQIADHSAELDGLMAAWPRLVDLASLLHLGASDATWRETLRNHRVAEIALQDPMASWSYARPRGYPGDARLIDFIYGHAAVQPLVDAASSLGRNVYGFTCGAETSVAVRERRRLLARLIDETVERVGNPDVLAVACGHLREVELSRGICDVRRLVALDQDNESLSELTRSYSDLSGVIETIQKSVGRLAVRPTILGKFDLIYAAGLYDYLEESTAAKLTGALFSALKPGGRLLFANFAARIPSEAYMDAFLDWRLLLREDADLQGLLDRLPHDEIARTRVFRGNNGAVIYALAVRR